MIHSRIRKALVLTLLCLCMLLCLPATAEQAYQPFESYTLDMPAGIKLQTETYDPQTGWLRIKVDSENSDFSLAASSGYSASRGSIIFNGTASAKASMSGPLEYMGFSPASQQNIDDMINNFRDYEEYVANDNGVRANMQWPLGRYDAEKAIFFPEEKTFGTAAVWNKDSKTIHLIMVELTYTSTEPVTAEMKKLPAANLLPDYHGVLVGETGAVIEPQDGAVRYTRKETTSKNLTTGFTVPGLESGWKVQYQSGNTTWEIDPVGATADGQKVFELTWPTWEVNGDSVSEASFSIRCLKGSDLKAAYQLSVVLVQGEKKPWPEYAATKPDIMQKITAFPTDRFVYSVENGFDGVSLSYKDGVLLQQVDNQKLILASNSQLENAISSIVITPPAEAKYYAHRTTGGQVVFGPDATSYYSLPAESSIKPLEEGQQFWPGYPFFQSKQYNEGQNVYYQNGLPYNTDLGGMVPLYFWYDKNRQLIGVEYYVIMAQPVRLDSRTTVLGDIADIPEDQFDKPFIVIAGFGDKGKNYTFHGQMFPAGENSRYYELQLLDNKGRPTALPSLKADRYIVYIPHPKGVALDGLSFYVSHYTQDGETVKDLYSFDHQDPSLRLYEAPNGKGFYFEVTSLSPFVVTWDEAEKPAQPAQPAAPQLPQTGDRTPVALLALLMGMACAGMLALKRKNVKN